MINLKLSDKIGNKFKSKCASLGLKMNRTAEKILEAWIDEKEVKLVYKK